jgi:hypothetical protein
MLAVHETQQRVLELDGRLALGQAAGVDVARLGQTADVL